MNDKEERNYGVYNITAITNDGSPWSTQVHGTEVEAVARLKTRIAQGVVNAVDVTRSTWDRPVLTGAVVQVVGPQGKVDDRVVMVYVSPTVEIGQ